MQIARDINSRQKSRKRKEESCEGPGLLLEPAESIKSTDKKMG